ncbi:MAG TPA: 8-oxo-dGTP diphosphatase [Bacillales bacterium]|nr:8-oxo-dGTP diphosphatase [Bacillales bacterium]
MLKYNLCLIRRGSQILLLNRETAAWMGCWNGVGGKLEENEHPRGSALREIYEETQIDVSSLQFKGLITWISSKGGQFGGLFLYLAELPVDFQYNTPIKTEEGILDWKEIDWILHPENDGVASNIPGVMEKVLHDARCFNHHSVFADDRMVDQVSTVVDPRVEEDEVLREAYLKEYVEAASVKR